MTSYDKAWTMTYPTHPTHINAEAEDKGRVKGHQRSQVSSRLLMVRRAECFNIELDKNHHFFFLFFPWLVRMRCQGRFVIFLGESPCSVMEAITKNDLVFRYFESHVREFYLLCI